MSTPSAWRVPDGGGIAHLFASEGTLCGKIRRNVAYVHPFDVEGDWRPCRLCWKRQTPEPEGSIWWDLVDRTWTLARRLDRLRGDDVVSARHVRFVRACIRAGRTGSRYAMKELVEELEATVEEET